MEKYNYFEAVNEVVLDLIKNGEIDSPNDDTYLDIYNELFKYDTVTGYASGSYTCNRLQAEGNLFGNLGLLQEACECLGEDLNLYDPEWCDVLIRCHILGSVLNKICIENERIISAKEYARDCEEYSRDLKYDMQRDLNRCQA